MKTAIAPDQGPTALSETSFDPAPRATLGCIQLPTDLTLEQEGAVLVSQLDGVRLRTQKLELDGDSLDIENYSSARGRISRAASVLRPADSFDALGLACTSLAFTLGIEDVHGELGSAHPGARVTDMASSITAALEHLEARRVALLTPYVAGLHRLNLSLLRDRGFEVVSDRNLGLTSDERISAVSQGCIRDLVRQVDDPDADAFVIGCSAFRACSPGYLDALEEALQKPVLGSQQAFLWQLLRLAGVEDALEGYGRLFGRRDSVWERSGSSGEKGPPAGVEDHYPTRVVEPGVVERVDPVVAPAAPGPLGEAQRREFERRGVLTLRSVFGPTEVEALRDRTRALRDHYESKSYDELDRCTDMRIITERGGTLLGDGSGPPVLKSIWQVHLPPENAPHMLFAADLSRRTVCDARLVDVARQLVGDEVYVHQSRINFQPGISEHGSGGSGFLWHQDFEQWHAEDGMPRMRAVSMAILLERAVPANGALMVMPGSHRQMIQARGAGGTDATYAEGALSRGPELPTEVLAGFADRFGIEHCPGEPGDVVVFDCNTVHGSHTNITPWGRSMFFCVYNAVSNTPAPAPFGSSNRRPEHIGSHDPRFAGVPLPSLEQCLTDAPGEPA